MRPEEHKLHPALHAGLTNVLPDQHHLRPDTILAQNTTLVVSPLPGGPGIWDVSVPFEVTSVRFTLRSVRTVMEGGGKAGVAGEANTNQLHATATTFGGRSSIAKTAMNAVYAKPAGAMYLSDKIFDSVGDFINLTEAWLYDVSPGVRVFRTHWMNFAASLKTLSCRLQLTALG